MTNKSLLRNTATALAGAVNRDNDKAGFADQLCHREHRTLQQLSFGVMIACIKEWAKAHSENRFDARNEATVKLCSEIVEHFGDRLDYLPYI